MQNTAPVFDTAGAPPGDEEHLRATLATANLKASKVLLKLDGSDAGFAAMFAALRGVFAFNQALVLDEDEHGIRCIAATAPDLCGRIWTGSILPTLFAGRVMVSAASDSRCGIPCDLVASGQPALCFPIGVNGHGAALLLRRAAGAADFTSGEIATARHCAVIALALLAAESGERHEAEIGRLNRLVEELRRTITERKQIEDELTQRAYFDELTGLPNRLLIQSHVEEVLRRNSESGRFALAFIDLDNFKHINDYYSHAIGDALLIKVAHRIANRLHDGDVLSRISGDEFLLVFDPVEDDGRVRTVIDALLEDLKQPFHIEAFEIFTSASIGVSFYPEHGRNYEALRRNADSAMYRAKGDSKGAAIYFDARMGKAITARMEQEQRLRLAIRDRRFCCAFQPKVDIRSQSVVGFETLIRWRDDDGEIHAPGSFIGLAIELGLIDPITHFVLSETVRSIERLDAAFGSGTTVSINIAAQQASDLKFMLSFAESLKACHWAERIMLEVTEDAFAAKSQFQLQVLPMLRDIGVRVSIDDFGTGYSCLSVLSEITADEIKVDRSFITAIHQRPRSQSILRTIESLGHSLGMSIVAEGVETEEELSYLQTTTRIGYAQGFYFSKPFYLDEISHGRRLIADGRESGSAREPMDRRRSLMLRGAAAG